MHKYILLLMFFLALPTWAQDSTKDEAGIALSTNASEEQEGEKTTENTEDLEAPKETINVKWYQPFQEKGEKRNFRLVTISGVTTPLAEVSIATKKIPVLTAKDAIKMYPRKRALVDDKKVQANEKGFFHIKLLLPRLRIQLPVAIKTTTGVEKIYQFNIHVKNTKVVAQGQNLEESPLLQNTYGLWFGGGINLVKYDQVSTAINSDLSLSSVKSPSLFAKFWYKIDENYNANLTYNQAPGSMPSSAGGLNLSGNRDYIWTVLALEGAYYDDRWRDQWGKDSWLGLLFGVQYHNVPFLSRPGPSATDVEIITNDITMLTVGGQYLRAYKEKWIMEGLFRLQAPVLSGSEFDVTMRFAFDGSLGTYKKFGKNFRAGLFWYGQWHEYNFSNHRDRVTDTNIGGTQSLFFTNLEFRLGYQW